MLRGEYIRGDGLVLPNSLTLAGAHAILAAAFNGTWGGMYMALVTGFPTPYLQMDSLIEPTIGTGGYARQEMVRDTDWPTTGELNGVPYVESAPKIFPVAAPGYDQPILRMALVPTLADLVGDVYSISAPLPAVQQILDTTPEESRTFRYRIYMS